MHTHNKLFELACIIVLNLPILVSAEVISNQPLSHQKFEENIRNDIAPLANKQIVGLKVFHLSADIGPWMDTGLSVAGENVTVLLNGKMWLSRKQNMWNPTPLSVWLKQGENGLIFHGTRETIHLYLRLKREA